MLVESGGTLQSFIDLDASTGGADGRIGFNLGGLDIDVRMSGDTVADLFRTDASLDRVGIGTGSPVCRLHVNAGSDNTAARFESTDTETVIELVDTTGRAQIRSRNDLRFYVNGDSVRAMDISSTGNVGIGETSPSAPLHINTSNVGSSNPNLIVETDNGNASVGPEVHIIRSSSTPANDDPGGIIRFYANDDAGGVKQTGYIYSQISDVSSASFGGKITYAVNSSNSMESAMILYPASTVFNEGSVDRDFRVESNANTHMLFVDAGNNRIGINEDAPEEILHIRADGSNDAKIVLENESNPRNNYIGMVGSDNLVIAADEDNIGTDSNIQFRVDNAERMRIEKDGRVAIFANGTAQQAAQAELHIIRADTGPARIRLQRTGSNAQGDPIAEIQFYNNDGSNDGPNNVAKIRAEAYTASGSGGRLLFYTHDATEGGEGSDPVRRMTIDGNGRVGIGTNAPEANLHIIDDTTTGPVLLLENGSGTEGDICVDDTENMQIGGWTGSAFNEKMVLGSNGDVSLKYCTNYQIGRDYAGSYYDSGERHFYIWAGGSGNYTHIAGRNAADGSPAFKVVVGGAVKAEIEANGDYQSATNQYGGTSDERLKENITASGSQWNDIKAVQVKKYSMIEDGLDAPDKIGVIAQDLQAAGMGGLVKQHFKVDAEENPILDADGNQEEYYTVKYSILYMKAIKALQEAMERIETLETEQTAIKARLDALEAT